MMTIQNAYNIWSKNYDTVANKTRDLEAQAIQNMLYVPMPLDILELGCGTGKNTIWLKKLAKKLICFDFSEEMMQIAQERVGDSKVKFIQKDLNTLWSLEPKSIDLITCSLVLEHIENLDFIFAEARKVLTKNGRFYIGEYHPFKQYLGKKARFETAEGLYELECYTHHISDFRNAAHVNGFDIYDIREWFDADDTTIPRILTMVFVLR